MTITNIKTTAGQINNYTEAQSKVKTKVPADTSALVETLTESNSTKVSLSMNSNFEDMPYDAAKVDRIKSQIASGTFVMNSSKIADKILESLIK